ncbi:MAG TPA: carboxypeptidase regulatory-like domain-containing protein [Polyangiaceae bacterium]|nr:carboxypeptidase regulatory-like domain-containing protein [Polyangiaceae bacterium]
MTTRDSGSSNLLDEFFALPKDANDDEVEVVEEVEEGDDAAAIANAAPRRSLPPPPPSMRAGRGPSAPPPRGRGPSRPPAPPPPPLKSTLRGSGELPVVVEPPPAVRSTLVGMPEPIFHAPPPAAEPGDESTETDASAAPPPVESAYDDQPASSEEGAIRGQAEPETTPGAFDGQETDLSMQGDDAPPAAADATEHEHTDVRPPGDADMATALAGSLSLRGDTPSEADASMARMDVVAPDVERERTSAIFDAVPTPSAETSVEGPSSAWPTPAKIDEWDDDWAPSLSALGAGQRDGSLRETAPESPKARASAVPGAPFRLSLPPPPPPPLKRKVPLPRPEPEVPVSVDEEPIVEAAAPPVAAEEAPEEAPSESPPAEDEGRPELETRPAIDMEVSPFGAADEPSREDLTRPLPPTELARLAADEGLERSESELLRDDVTIPLPGLSTEAANAESPFLSALPDPYTSDTDLTRPLIPLSERGDAPRSAMLPPLRPPLDGPTTDDNDVPLIVAVPPPSVGTVEHAPSIQITPGAPDSEYTPTSQLARPFSPTRTSPGMRSVLPPIPKPAPVPADIGKRGPSPSVAPVTGSVFPPGFAPNKRWLVGLAAAVLGLAALGLGLHNRSGSIVVTVAGPSGAAVPGVSVRIDGTERCNSAPCIVKDLKPGMHLVSAAAAGLPPSADRAVVLEPGEQIAQHVVLSSEERATAGLSVAAIGTGLHVTVDGRDVGAPPVTLNDVTPGEHTVRILGDDRYYQPYEEVVRLDRGEVRSLGPVRLRVLRGKLELRPGEGSEGATVAVDGRRISHLPATLELSAEESHEVTADKPGHGEFTQDVVFDGTAEHRVTIAFGPDSSGSAPSYRTAPSFPVAQAAAPTRSRAASASFASASAAAPAGTATLDITSTPPAAVVVNGRPLGTTPLHNVHVGAGRQTVLFVHPSLGRKIASANVAPGGRATIGVKF